ncbi:hypothetical protein LJK87_49290 [Paenibacillus sp. P25]|nr:hypothetical protein LJK87_49290 [Paenibacillus sp. P25]
MSVPTQTILLVKSVTGRSLLDTSKHGCPFRLEGQEGQWRLAVQNVAPQMAEEIRNLLTELNLFYFEDYGAEADRRKWWLYDSACPEYAYDPAGKMLELKVDRRVGYTNEHAGKV